MSKSAKVYYRPNRFVIWTQHGVELTGLVSSHKKGVVTMTTSAGIEVSFPDTDTIERTTKPENWGKTESTPVVTKTKKVTKVQQIIELFKDNVPATRKEAIEKIVSAGITTPKGASTFWQTAKSKL